ncbi:fimbrial protein [Dyella sedimenti]|uniref:fimbrial protein n=1 Tax=Dyella sedimenti TaxID=2919947 RepID=UPI001FAAE37A|nr:fimbrial protein [Dyella sedimenti]
MKRTSVSTVLVAALGLAALFPGHVQALEGILTFYGQLDDATCDLAGGGAATGDDHNFSVTLPAVSAAGLPVYTGGGETPFSLIVSGANCTNGKLVSLWIDRTISPAITPQGTLRNATYSSDMAEGVEIELLNAANGNRVNLAVDAPLDDGSGDTLGANNQPVATISNHTASLNYIVRYYNPGPAGAITPGRVQAHIAFTLQYN